ncbi:MAG: trigger factor [Desulfobacterales bacterium]|nr:trigger factor [Desulfobacterales bacterium]
MQVSVQVEDVSSIKKVLHIVVPQEKVNSELNNAYDNLKKTSKIKGFRPGKTPRAVLESMFEKQVHAEVVPKLIEDSYWDAIKETGFHAVGIPEIDPAELKPNSPYEYKAKIEINPIIPHIDFKGLSLTKNKYHVSEEELDAQIGMHRKRMGIQKVSDSEYSLKMGDWVHMQLSATADEKPIENMANLNNHLFKVGEAEVLKDIWPELIGLRVNEEKDFAISFGSDHPEPMFCNKTISFHVKIIEIRIETLPELDDAFAISLGFQSVDVLRNYIRDDLQHRYNYRAEQELYEDMYRLLLTPLNFEVPEAMVHAEMQGILAEIKESYEQNNLPIDEFEKNKKEFSNKYRDIAIGKARRVLLIDTIISQEKLALNDDDIEQGLKFAAASQRQTVAVLKQHYQKNKDQFDYFKQALLEKKAIDLILSYSKIEEVEPNESHA